MSDRKEFEDWFFSPSNSMSMSDMDVAWDAWQASAQRPQAVPMTDEQINAVALEQWGPHTGGPLAAHQAYLLAKREHHKGFTL